MSALALTGAFTVGGHLLAATVLGVLAAIGPLLTRGPNPLAAVWLPNAMAVAWLLRHSRSPIATAALAGRDRMRGELATARHFNAAMLENMREVVFRTDREGRWEWLNPAWRELTGRSPTAALNGPAVAFVHPDDRSLLTKALATRGGRRVTLRWLSARGEQRLVEVSARAIVSPDGRPLGGIGSIRDVTERQEALDAMRESRRVFETLASLSPAGIFRTTAAGSLDYANPAWWALRSCCWAVHSTPNSAGTPR